MKILNLKVFNKIFVQKYKNAYKNNIICTILLVMVGSNMIIICIIIFLYTDA